MKPEEFDEWLQDLAEGYGGGRGWVLMLRWAWDSLKWRCGGRGLYCRKRWPEIQRKQVELWEDDDPRWGGEP